MSNGEESVAWIVCECESPRCLAFLFTEFKNSLLVSPPILTWLLLPANSALVTFLVEESLIMDLLYLPLFFSFFVFSQPNNEVGQARWCSRRIDPLSFPSS